MPNETDPTLLSRWFPVAAASELVRRHVFQTELLGAELALWRADDGEVNLWENRCPHRGLRLTLGHNLGQELRCQYHGWRYASGSGRCTAIAAHPALTPSKGIGVTSYACTEKYGLVWANLASDQGVPLLPALEGAATLTLRSLPFNVGTSPLLEALSRSALPPIPRPGAVPPPFALRALDQFTLEATAAAELQGTLVLLLQPLDGMRTVIHGALAGAYPAEDQLRLRRHFSDLLSDLRRRIEAGAPAQPRGTAPEAVRDLSPA